MTPEEALQHEWIKEGLVHRRPRESKEKPKPSHRPSPAQSEQSGPPDPYKVPAQPPVKGMVLNHSLTTSLIKIYKALHMFIKSHPSCQSKVPHHLT